MLYLYHGGELHLRKKGKEEKATSVLIMYFICLFHTNDGRERKVEVKTGNLMDGKKEGQEGGR